MINKYIKFIDSDYNTLFYVADGEPIRIKSPDGDIQEFKCKYIDETHAQIGLSVFHLCEFAERMEYNGNIYEPVYEIGDIEFYQKRFFDRTNHDSEGKTIPYYSLVELTSNKGTSNEENLIFAFCFAPASPNKAFCRSTKFKYKTDTFFEHKFASNIEELCADDKLCAKIKNIISAIEAKTTTINPSLDKVIESATKAQTESASKSKVLNERDR